MLYKQSSISQSICSKRQKQHSQKTKTKHRNNSTNNTHTHTLKLWRPNVLGARKALELWKLRPVVTYRGCGVEANRGVQWAVVGSHLECVGGQRFTVQVCSILEINVTLQHTHSFKTSMETVIMIWMMLTHSAHMCLLLHSSDKCHPATHAQLQNIHGNNDHDLYDANSFSPHAFTAPQHSDFCVNWLQSNTTEKNDWPDTIHAPQWCFIVVANCLTILLTTKTNTTYSHTINPEVGVVDAVPHHPIVTLISVGGMNTFQGISASRVLQKVYFVHSLDRKRCKHWAGSSITVYKSDPVTKYFAHTKVSTHCSKHYFAGFRMKAISQLVGAITAQFPLHMGQTLFCIPKFHKKGFSCEVLYHYFLGPASFWPWHKSVVNGICWWIICKITQIDSYKSVCCLHDLVNDSVVTEYKWISYHITGMDQL